MTVFNTYLKVIKKNLPTIILYTCILVFFAAFSVTSGDNINSFENSKPKIMIVNQDTESAVTRNLVNYLSDHAEVNDSEMEEEARNDALFYREVSYIIQIPQNYGEDVLTQKSPEITIKSTGTYESALAEMMLTKYLRVQNIYAKEIDQSEELIKKINTSLSGDTKVEILSKLDTNTLNNQAYYFNFAAYSIMACVVFIVCLVLSSFNQEMVRKRTIISSMSNRKYNISLILSSSIYAVLVWIFFAVIGFLIVGESIASARGLIFLLNSFIYTVCVLALAYMLSTLIKEKNAVTGIVNVLALGSSFLCGVFVSTEYLPDWVLKISHVLPTYWYVNSNNKLKEIEELNTLSLSPVIINMLVLLGFMVMFIVIALIVSNRKRKFA